MTQAFRNALATVTRLLSQGITPQKVSLAISLAAVLAVFPVLGSTTLLCAGAATLLGLNLPLMQLVNWLMYPVQLILLIPFLNVGVRLFGLRPLPSLSELLVQVREHPWQTIQLHWPATLSAIGAWVVLSPLVCGALYLLLLLPLRRLRLSTLEAQ